MKFNIMVDKFENYLKNVDSENKTIALTSSSYRNIEHKLHDNEINNRLATYGDALLKLALCDILFDEKVENITEEKQKYESDEVLVKVIAKHYNLLDYMRYDYNDKKIPENYEYSRAGNSSPHKYIATVVEALLAAFYFDNDEDIKLVINIVKEWKNRIGNN